MWILPVAVSFARGAVTPGGVTPADEWRADDVTVAGGGRRRADQGTRRRHADTLHSHWRPVYPLQQKNISIRKEQVERNRYRRAKVDTRIIDRASLIFMIFYGNHG